ncbi:hypothetical protein [Allocoleopsis sp.]|uniref:hypothetical protein n=1 Tax=Allocoleopsis sp. TaxID=3088169 RepID=UPI002FD05C68
MFLRRFSYRNHAIILSQDKWEVLGALRWFADVEPPEKDGLYEGDGWETPKKALIEAIQFIDALINGDFAELEPQLQPIKIPYPLGSKLPERLPSYPLVNATSTPIGNGSQTDIQVDLHPARSRRESLQQLFEREDRDRKRINAEKSINATL